MIRGRGCWAVSRVRCKSTLWLLIYKGLQGQRGWARQIQLGKVNWLLKAAFYNESQQAWFQSVYVLTLMNCSEGVMLLFNNLQPPIDFPPTIRTAVLIRKYFRSSSISRLHGPALFSSGWQGQKGHANIGGSLAVSSTTDNTSQFEKPIPSMYWNDSPPRLQPYEVRIRGSCTRLQASFPQV